MSGAGTASGAMPAQDPPESLRVFFATSEAYPLVKVGGLGDVSYALPRSMARRGHRVLVFLPRYTGLPAGTRLGELTVRTGSVADVFEVAEQGEYGGVRYYTVGRPDGAAWDPPEGYVEKDLYSYVLFSRAVAQLAVHPDWRADVVHCNDWHVGHVPAYLRTLAAPCRTLMTIHNLFYQGHFHNDEAVELGLADYGTGNLLAQGIAHADVVTTVSRRYRDETLTPAHGFGLQDLLRSRGEDYHGLLNGIDYGEFDPATDPHLVANYDVHDVTGKAANKAALQRTCGLPEDRGVPLFAFVGRLVRQKGVELLLDGIDEIATLDIQLVVVGRGALYERAFQRATRHYRNVAVRLDSGETAARLAYAGSDAFLAPSEFEPCGLAPLIGLRYGSVPVVRRVGGMAETVAETGLGFAFDGGSVADLMTAMRTLVSHHADPTTWARLRERGMLARFSWDDTAASYEQLYRRPR